MNVFVNGVDVNDPTEAYDGNADPSDVFWSFFNSSQVSALVGFPTTAIASLNTPDGTVLTATSTFPTDFADLQMWVGTYIAPTPENLGKFITNGKPVDPAVAAAAFGQPQVLFSGDNSPTGYQKNQGTWGDIFALSTSFQGTGVDAPGPVTLTGARVGQTVFKIYAYGISDQPHDVTSDFETTISVNDQIQQTSGSLSGDPLQVMVSGDLSATLTNATTSPSN
jgi:hypothetical protein